MDISTSLLMGVNNSVGVVSVPHFYKKLYKHVHIADLWSKFTTLRPILSDAESLAVSADLEKLRNEIFKVIMGSFCLQKDHAST